MAEGETPRRVYVLWAGDRALWMDHNREVVPVNIELVTDDRVYLRARAAGAGRRRGQVWYESRFTRRVVPEQATYILDGRGHFRGQVVLRSPEAA